MLLATSWGAVQLKRRGLKASWMTWRAVGLTDVARRVIGCHLAREMRVQSALDDVASDTRQGRHLTQETRTQSVLDDVASNIRHDRVPFSSRDEGSKCVE